MKNHFNKLFRYEFVSYFISALDTYCNNFTPKRARAVARGASLVNISKSAIQKNALALWEQRFMTTFSILRKRLFLFGGGAKRVLEEGKIEPPSGECHDIDFIESLKQGLPSDFSLDKTHG